MPQVMMLSRSVKRVPLDFDWPMNKRWDGYLSPSGDWPQCGKCGGDGIHPFAKPIAETFYALDLPGMADDPVRSAYRWGDKITQEEVDHLLAEGRLRTWVKDDSKRGGRWESLPRTAEEVNAEPLQHDGINRWILIKFRCERLGLPVECDECDGEGRTPSPEQRAEYDGWEPTEPPAGDGFQMWESVSEGSPISPVFPSTTALAAWLAEHPSGVTERFGYGDWLDVINGEVFGTNVADSSPVRTET
jgi:hypothetical protein